ncbi:triacylglycerol lipase [Nocardioides sp. GY 10113]|uniref:lipase family protein n=1 Tax=Nocardioides sp. GY 10113 TaxID=2569761 RepID=UPI0010A7F88B|nr:lipase family protein [Nocardioides sp. GY 10113]TIC88459.1 triacylglycerol lipase [Nocardioides sp. GY 10113]
MGNRPTRLVAALTGAALTATLALTGPAYAAPTRAATTGAAPAAVEDDPSPLDAPFYRYRGRTPLRKIAPGTVLKRRTVRYSIQGLDLPLKARQLLFRTVDVRRRPALGVTTVLRPPHASGRAKVVSYQSFYDSLDPSDQPSAAIAGGRGLGEAVTNVETGLIAPLLLAGYTVNIPDTEGQGAHFAAGPEYGYVTLDSLRALRGARKATGVGRRAPIGLIGYSGGAIASEWAAELASSYAPGVARRIVGTAIGGVLVNPAHNLPYVEGSTIWAGVAPMALIGIARAFGVDLNRWASPDGRELLAKMQDDTIAEVLGFHSGLMWGDVVKKRYPEPRNIRAFVRFSNRLIMSTGGTPTAPMFIGQGNAGELEGTDAGPAGIGPGDGVMITGDVRTLARRYCRRGVRVQYEEYDLSHFTSMALWLPDAYPWLLDRFEGEAVPSSCGSIKKGNPLRRLTYVAP